MARVYGCATEVAMEVLGGKWTVVLLARLKEGDQRYAELRRAMPGISEKVLAERLRMLTAEGLIGRTLVSATPPHVVYTLADRGQTLIPALEALHAWGTDWATQHDFEVEAQGPR